MKTTKISKGEYKVEANGKTYHIYNWGPKNWSLRMPSGKEEICETKKEAMFIILADK